MGPDGHVRWKFIHKNMVYVTDESMRHEITSWCRTSRIILRLGYEMSGTDLVPSCISCYSIAMRCPGLR